MLASLVDVTGFEVGFVVLFAVLSARTVKSVPSDFGLQSVPSG